MEKAPETKPTTAEVVGGAELPPIDALDPAQLEQFMIERSGLLKVRPPLPAAQSGDNFYHAIPFQVSRLPMLDTVPETAVACALHHQQLLYYAHVSLIYLRQSGTEDSIS